MNAVLTNIRTGRKKMISSETKVLGLIGDPVEHSISPPMHNACFVEEELDYVYVAFKVERGGLPDAIGGIKSMGIEGVNVTIPHKSAVMKYLDEVRENARRIGAVNTVKREGEKLTGYNTDGIGVLESLKNRIGKVGNKSVLLLGAGGAARAIAFTLAEAGADMFISNRTASKAENLSSDVKEKTGVDLRTIPQERRDLAKIIEDVDVLINSTSVGMHPNEDETPVEASLMHEGLTVMDIVYNPLRTRLLKEAESAGAKTIDGLGMLVYQGAASFEIWTGITPPIETMKRAARKALEER